MYGIRILPEICARTVCPFSSSTRNIALGRGSTTVPSTSITSSLATLQVSPLGLSPVRGRTQQRASDPGSRQYRSRSSGMSRNRSAGGLPWPSPARSSAVRLTVPRIWDTGPDADKGRDRGHHPCGAGTLDGPRGRRGADEPRADADDRPDGDRDAPAPPPRPPDADRDRRSDREPESNHRPVAVGGPEPVAVTSRASARTQRAVGEAGGAARPDRHSSAPRRPVA